MVQGDGTPARGAADKQKQHMQMVSAEMKYYIITDTHFGHDKMVEYCGRPDDFAFKIMNGIETTLTSNDVLIHLGDFCIGDDEKWHRRFFDTPFPLGPCWLIRGNHDKKSNTWYLSHGWDFVASSITLDVFGEQILLSHIPKPYNGYTMNVHGHFHNADHHRYEPEIKSIMTNRHRLVMMEHHYLPQDLRKIVGR